MDKLVERLRDAMRRIGAMASEGRPPKMSIPARPDHDDDIFICEAIRDAISALTADAVMERAAEICDGRSHHLRIEGKNALEQSFVSVADAYNARALEAEFCAAAIRAASAKVNAEGRVPCRTPASSSGPMETSDSTNAVSPPKEAGTLSESAPATQPAPSAPDAGQVVVPDDLLLRISEHFRTTFADTERQRQITRNLLAEIAKFRAAGSRHED